MPSSPCSTCTYTRSSIILSSFLDEHLKAVLLQDNPSIKAIAEYILSKSAGDPSLQHTPDYPWPRCPITPWPYLQRTPRKYAGRKSYQTCIAYSRTKYNGRATMVNHTISVISWRSREHTRSPTTRRRPHRRHLSTRNGEKALQHHLLWHACFRPTMRIYVYRRYAMLCPRLCAARRY